MISVLVPSRGRPLSLAASLMSLYDRAASPDAVEALVAIDPDDAATAAWAGALPPGTAVWAAPQRYGYGGIHRYYNELAARACGDWLLMWNDDARMLTEGWDQVIRRQEPGFLWPSVNHARHANTFPAWPAAWSAALGHVSPFPHPDTYLQWLGEAAGLLRRVPVEVLHDRADVTGGHDDATYAEGRGRLGAEGMVPGFDAAAVRARVADDVRRIGALAVVR